MGTVVARQAKLDQEQERMDKLYDETKNLKYIAGTEDEKYIRDYVSSVDNLVNKYINSDFSDPVVARQVRSEFRRMTDVPTIQNIQESYANYQANNKIRAQLKAQGLYDPTLDEDPANDPTFSSKNGVYNYIVSPYKNPRPTAETLFDDLKPRDLDVRGDYFFRGITRDDINRVAEAKWGDFANTSEGRAYIKKIAKENGLDPTDTNIRKQIAMEYLKGVGEEFIYEERGNPTLDAQVRAARGKKENEESPSKPLLTMESPSRNASMASKPNKMFKTDVTEAADISEQISQLNAELSKYQEGTSQYNLVKASINELKDRQNSIYSAIQQAEQDVSPELVSRKNARLEKFIQESVKAGDTEENAMAAFDYFTKQYGNKSGIGIATAKTFGKNPYEPMKRFGRGTYNRALKAFEDVNAINNTISREVANRYKDYAIKSVHDNMYVLSASGLEASSSASNVTTEGRQKVAATSEMLSRLKNQGGAFAQTVDITPGDSKNKITKISDIENHIMNSDYISLDRVSPTVDVNGDYRFIVNTHNNKDGNNITKTFDVILNKYSQPEITNSFIKSFAYDLMGNQQYTEAERLLDPELEIEFKSKKNDKFSVIAPDPKNPDKVMKINKVGENQYMIVDPDGRTHSNPITYEDVVMQLYGYRVRDKYYKD
jgi:hypothetical protein